ncbi:hypothetical protein [Deinococcus sp. NW-56]|uniref:hypothetical protein n=1 Tax=Deinococcus sp. NW-56 TaxID=2080419 RepID=UPI000CF4ECFD|nr:hypothetical protein [Deinococcus sp. NW-56]
MPQPITTDVPRFWQAFEHLDAPDAIDHFQRFYLDAGTPGVQAFIPERIVSAESLVTAVRARRAYYASIRERSLATLSDLGPRLDAVLARLPEVVPGAPTDDVYFVIGAMNSGGTLSRGEAGTFAIIGLEFFCAGPGAITDDLNSWERAVIRTPDALPSIVAHELVHTLQPVPQDAEPTLLLHCLAEGAAEYVGELISGEVINPSLHEYGLTHELTLRARFQRDMAAGVGPEHWLYQGNRAVDEPADLGYFIGAQIMRAYHGRYRDRPDVMHDLLHRALLEPRAFARKSGYFS